MSVQYIANEAATAGLLTEDGLHAIVLETSDLTLPAETPVAETGGNRLLTPGRRRVAPPPEFIQLTIGPAKVLARAFAPAISVRMAPRRALVHARATQAPHPTVSLAIQPAAAQSLLRASPTGQTIDRELHKLLEDALILAEI